MPTLGEELRHRREQRGITLAEIAEATRIGTRFLKAIETNNFSTLPGGIFTRSFIRAYAKHVGMNEDEAIGIYLQQVAEQSSEHQALQAELGGTQAPPTQKITKQPSATPPVKHVARVPQPARRFEPISLRQSRSRTSWPTIVIGAGILIFVVLIVLALVKQLSQSKEESGPATSVAQKNAPPKQPAQSTSQPGTPAQSTPSSSQPEQPAPPPVQGQALVVKLEAATGDSWVKYQVDDAKPTTLILKQGQSQDLPPAQNQITLNYGNRMTLKLKINNRDASFPPETPKFASQVIISRNNLQTYFQ